MSDYRTALLTFAFYLSSNGFQWVSSHKNHLIHDQMKAKQCLLDLSFLGLQCEHQHQLCGSVFPVAGSYYSYLIYLSQLLWLEPFFFQGCAVPALRTAEGYLEQRKVTWKQDLDLRWNFKVMKGARNRGVTQQWTRHPKTTSKSTRQWN